MVENISGVCDKEGCNVPKGFAEENSRQIISSISHELRTPLSIISSNLQMLEDCKELDDEMRQETFELCGEAIKSMSRFLDDIYFLNVSNKGELKKDLKKFNLEKYCKNIVKELSFSEFDEERIKLTCNFSEPKITTDKELLRRVFYNVISNAIKFSPEDVLVDVDYNGENLFIKVEDKGIGIPPEELELVIEPFFRGNNVKMIAGTGLGLSITKKSLDCLGGKIDFESIIGEGTKVKLIIPNNGK